MKEVILPKFGFTQETAQIVRWIKRAGDAVEQGDPIAEVTTDKVNMEVEAPASGILDGLQFPEGAEVPVATVIAYVRKEAERPGDRATGRTDGRTDRQTDGQTDGRTSRPVDQSTPRPGATPLAAKVAAERGVNVNAVVGTGPGGKVTRRDVETHAPMGRGDGGTVERWDGGPDGRTERLSATPAARRLAREHDIALGSVPGSGPSGRVQGSDVLAYARRSDDPTSRTADQPTPRLPDPSTTRRRLTGMRRTIATRLQQSMQQAPHVYFEAVVDVSAAEALRAKVNGRLGKEAPRVSLTAVIAKACAWALLRHPLVNSRLEGAAGAEEIVLSETANLGIAVALDEGLIVPVVKQVEAKGLAQLAVELGDLAERARTNRLRADDLTEGTFTLSNLGMFGVNRFTAIINPPQVAILAVGAVRRSLVPGPDDAPVVRPLMTVTLSADHRVVDGAVAARFLQDVRAAVEEPGLGLM
jgi:pyruvate dehydrogenase E2 component (dihydrolipoamide acetyltransferase)